MSQFGYGDFNMTPKIVVGCSVVHQAKTRVVSTGHKTLIYSKSSSEIDFALVSWDMLKHVVGFQVLRGWQVSSHRAVALSFLHNERLPPRSRDFFLAQGCPKSPRMQRLMGQVVVGLSWLQDQLGAWRQREVQAGVDLLWRQCMNLLWGNLQRATGKRCEKDGPREFFRVRTVLPGARGRWRPAEVWQTFAAPINWLAFTWGSSTTQARRVGHSLSRSRVGRYQA